MKVIEIETEVYSGEYSIPEGEPVLLFDKDNSTFDKVEIFNKMVYDAQGNTSGRYLNDLDYLWISLRDLQSKLEKIAGVNV